MRKKNGGESRSKSWRRHPALWMFLHVEAFWLCPHQYLAGLWWRLLGKRLRARSRLSPLLGHSPRAYAAWLARGGDTSALENCLSQFHALEESSVISEITVVIDAGANPGALARTLASLERPEAAVVIEGMVGSSIRSASVALAADRITPDVTWLLPMKAGDVLASGALDVYRYVAARTSARVVYADDDELNSVGKRCAPHFKPKWNPELFGHHDYLSGACIIRADNNALSAICGDPDWISRLLRDALREEEGVCKPQHLPAILHHRAERPAPMAPTVPKFVVQEQSPAVSVIIPTRNGVEILRNCLKGLEGTKYPIAEIIVVDNDSDDLATIRFLNDLDPQRYKLLRYPGAFNYSAINNVAVRSVCSPFICFLNNDIEMIQSDWLTILMMQAMRDGVGAVGPMLLYPDGRVQHAGVVLGVGGGAAHAHRDVSPDEVGYFRRHALPQFVSAVTGACLVVRRSRFDEAGGFDEENFAVAFNDVDLCLRLGRLGYKSLYEPRSRLMHHESKTRGYDRDPIGARRLAGELAALKRIWQTDMRPDPYHHFSLSPYSEQFVLDL